jgi:spore coat polysaccharide biosynthesis protein SpsF (cytidylyltransferase family)
LAVLQARVSSTRLPGKVLLPVLGEPMLARQIERVRRSATLDDLVVATSTDAGDGPLAELCERLGTACFRGSLDDVLDRFLGAAREFGADHIVRLTGDCPLADAGVIDDVVRLHLEGGFDYTSNVAPPTFPDGLDMEIVTMAALEAVGEEANRRALREHVTLMLREQTERFVLGNLVHEPDLSAMRWTVDEPEDLEFVRAIYAALYPHNPEFTWLDVLGYITENPGVEAVNSAFSRNEGLAKSQNEDAKAIEPGGARDV